MAATRSRSLPRPALNATLAAGNGLKYTPDSGFTGDDDLNISVTDQTDTLNGSADVDLSVQGGSSFGFVATTAYADDQINPNFIEVEREGSLVSSDLVTCTVSESTSSYTTGVVFAPDQTLATISFTAANTSPVVLSLTSISAADSLLTGQSVATVTVLATATAPLAVPDSYTVQENQILEAGPGMDQPGLLDQDIEFDNDPLTLTEINGATASYGSPVLLTSEKKRGRNSLK